MKSSTKNHKNNNIKEHDILQHKLQNFTVRHTSHHIPLALVTSGGTSAPLEHNCVRYLDNFSTGTRGAFAVEEFLKRGYAVIHLKRVGSVAPFGRILNNVLKCGRDGLNFESLGSLFDCTDGDSNDNDDVLLDFGLQDIDEEDDDTYEEKKNTTSTDPWMYSSNNDNEHTHQQYPKQQTKSRRSNQRGEISINPQLAQSSILQSTLRQYKHIKQQGMLITINFQAVDDYLHKLQLCSEAINMCGSLGLVYLAAAVSDFYIPQEKRALHKIQSRDYGIKSQASSSIESSSSGDEHCNTDVNNIENTMQIEEDNTLTLKLYPVPKVIPTLRKEWCPNAFVVSFKLETDSTILQQKAVLAMKRNNVHMIVGNELSTRYEKVFILSHKIDGFDNDVIDGEDDKADLPEGYHIAKVTADNVDELESATIEYVVRRHFHYISTNISGSGSTMPNLISAAEMTACHVLQAKSLHEKRIVNTYRQLQYESLKSRAGEIAWNVFGSALGMFISYGIGRMIQSRQH